MPDVVSVTTVGRVRLDICLVLVTLMRIAASRGVHGEKGGIISEVVLAAVSR